MSVSRTLPTPWLDRLNAFRDAAEMRANLLGGFGLRPGELPKSACLAGASSAGLAVAGELAAAGVSILGVFDDDARKQGSEFVGHRVQAVDRLAACDTTAPVILATHVIQGLSRRIRAMGHGRVWPFQLLSFLDPEAFAVHPFYAGMLEALYGGRGRLADTMAALEDDKSRRVLDAAIGFRLTLDVSVYDGLLQPFPYLAEDLLRFTPDEVMVDGGSFEGDTIREFVVRTGGRFKGVIAFEPAERTYEVLCRSMAADPRIRPVRACLHDRDTMVSFEDTGGRSAAMVSDGGSQCPAKAIDGLPEAEDITFIKLNVEGAEAQALRGAARTIAARCPKLAIAAYHKPPDLWELPQLLRGMQPAYRLYFRQHTAGLQETVLYAVSGR
jgi:FkbM family methyltransferase